MMTILDRCGPDCSPAHLKTLLCPIVASSPAQQERFYRIFDQWYPMLTSVDPTGSEARAVLAAERIEVAKRPPSRSRRTTAIAALVVVLVAVPVIATLLLRGSQQSASTTTENRPPAADTARPTPAPTIPAPSPVVPPPAINIAAPSSTAITEPPWPLIQASAILLILGTFVVIEWRILRRRKVVLERQRRAKPPLVWPIRVESGLSPFTDSADFLVTARRLREREQGERQRLDVAATVRATIEALGYPVFRYARETRSPEYLVLIERASLRDHQSRLYRHLLELLAREGVHSTVYFFEEDPRICEPASGESAAMLSEIRRKYPTHRLLLFGTGDALVDPITGSRHSWVSEAFAWPDRAMLTPHPVEAWSARETTLATHFIVLPATIAGLQAGIDYFQLPTTPSVTRGRRGAGIDAPDLTRSNRVERLRSYLGDRGLQWVCACAVYPELQWDLTLHLGALPELGHGQIGDELLLKLVRLPWYRTGAIPDDARMELLRVIHPEVERAARRAVISVLERNPAPAETIASTRYELDLVVQKLALHGPDTARRQELLRAAERLPRQRVLRELAVLRLSERAPASSLVMRLPDRFRQMFFQHGAPIFGLTTGARSLVALALVSGVFLVGRNRSVNNTWKVDALDSTTFAATLAGAPVAAVPPADSALDARDLAQLRDLDSLRAELATLSGYVHNGVPLRLRLTMSGVNARYRRARPVFFAAFQRAMFARTRDAIVTALRRLPDSPTPRDDYGAAYSALKAYVIITAEPRRSTSAFLAPVLLQHWREGRGLDSEPIQIAGRLFDFYATELAYENIFVESADSSLLSHARAYLKQFAGVEPIYQHLLAEAAKSNPPIQFSRIVPEAAQVIVAPYEVPGAFTRSGWAFMQQAFGNIGSYFAGERWVLGAMDTAPLDTARVAKELRARYAADYIRVWRSFLQAIQVIRFASVDDARAKLSALGSNRSYLLSLFSLVAQQTHVSPALDSAFQPVHLVTPPAANGLVGQFNQNYMKALITLQAALEQTANARGPAADQAAQQAAGVVAAAKITTAQMAAAFQADAKSPVSAIVRHLIEAPLDNAAPLVVSFGADRMNARAGVFCAQARGLLQSLFFSADGSTDLSVADVSSILRPGSGELASFYREALQDALQKQGDRYVPTGSMKLSPAFVAFFNRAASLSDALFAEDRAAPRISFIVEPQLPDGASMVTLTLEGITIRSGQNLASMRVTWPRNGGDSRVSAIVRGTEVTGPTFTGPWSALQLFYAAEWRPENDGYRLEWRTGARKPDGSPLQIAVRVTGATRAGMNNVLTVFRRPPTVGQACGGFINAQEPSATAGRTMDSIRLARMLRPDSAAMIVYARALDEMDKGQVAKADTLLRQVLAKYANFSPARAKLEELMATRRAGEEHLRARVNEFLAAIRSRDEGKVSEMVAGSVGSAEARSQLLNLIRQHNADATLSAAPAITIEGDSVAGYQTITLTWREGRIRRTTQSQLFVLRVESYHSNGTWHDQKLELTTRASTSPPMTFGAGAAREVQRIADFLVAGDRGAIARTMGADEAENIQRKLDGHPKIRAVAKILDVNERDSTARFFLLVIDRASPTILVSATFNGSFAGTPGGPRLLTATRVLPPAANIGTAPYVKFRDPRAWQNGATAIVDSGQTLRIFGVAFHPRGVAQVFVDGESVSLEPDPPLATFEHALIGTNERRTVTILLVGKDGGVWLTTCSLGPRVTPPRTPLEDGSRQSCGR
jgi:hypothetical protein